MILVTGAAGFIGSNLVERLVREGEEVFGLDAYTDFYDPSMKRRNAAAIAHLKGFRMVEGDILDPAALDECLGKAKASAVVHLAARPGVRQSLANPLETDRANVEGTLRVLEACLRHGVGRLVFASSSSVYGGCEKVPFAEDDPLGPMRSPYAITKRAGEILCRQFFDTRGLPCACLRFFTVYGQRQRPDLALHKFARLIAARKPIPIYGDGSSERDYTYIDDILDGVVAACRVPVSYEILNLGSHRAVAVRDFLSLLERQMGIPAIRLHEPDHPEDAVRTFADVAKSKRVLGYEPKMPLEEGVRRFLDWFAREGRP
ncbi:MAG: NAD-dependent epimerase/dehydratase family protein [Planctomycetota bacterium]